MWTEIISVPDRSTVGGTLFLKQNFLLLLGLCRRTFANNKFILPTIYLAFGLKFYYFHAIIP